jgi:hypothetical protein
VRECSGARLCSLGVCQLCIQVAQGTTGTLQRTSSNVLLFTGRGHTASARCGVLGKYFILRKVKYEI